MTKAMRREDDPKGYTPVVTNLNESCSCTQCDITNGSKVCRATHCLSWDRPDRKSIHFKKEKK